MAQVSLINADYAEEIINYKVSCYPVYCILFVIYSTNHIAKRRAYSK